MFIISSTLEMEPFFVLLPFPLEEMMALPFSFGLPFPNIGFAGRAL